jgi:hypothetical protein
LSLDVLLDFGWLRVQEAKAVGGRATIQIHKLGDPIADPIGDARDHDSSVTVPEEHDLM